MKNPKEKRKHERHKIVEMVSMTNLPEFQANFIH